MEWIGLVGILLLFLLLPLLFLRLGLEDGSVGRRRRLQPSSFRLQASGFWAVLNRPYSPIRRAASLPHPLFQLPFFPILPVPLRPIDFPDNISILHPLPPSHRPTSAQEKKLRSFEATAYSGHYVSSPCLFPLFAPTHDRQSDPKLFSPPSSLDSYTTRTRTSHDPHHLSRRPSSQNIWAPLAVDQTT